ncbi:signal peptidase I [Helcobacillus sp. ACRRO]|nr:signal peptidase I [Helcobacillus sp. ACRRO]MCG7427768.1 signal peptidase I [Helcobacillus sp. ACRRO]
MWTVVAVSVILALLAVLGVRQFVTEPFRIPSESMQPTLQRGDVILVDRSTRGTAERGQVVVFDGTGYFSSADGSTHFWTKRVIGIGGDEVQCCSPSGAITVNGDELDEPYLPLGVKPSAQEFHVKVPAGRMFVLGDNRENSADSRSQLGAPGGGMVPVERVRGEVRWIVLPPGRFGGAPNLG